MYKRLYSEYDMEVTDLVGLVELWLFLQLQVSLAKDMILKSYVGELLTEHVVLTRAGAACATWDLRAGRHGGLGRCCAGVGMKRRS